jgi:hypothetical protein
MLELTTIIYGSAILAALLFALRRGAAGLLVATVFLIPWFGLQTDIGVTINADRLVAVVLLVALVRRFGPSAWSVFTPFLLYAVADTVAQSLSLPANVVDYAPTKGQWRWLFQLPMWAVLIVPGAAVARFRSWELIRRALVALVASGVILSMMGLFQVAFYYATGVDLFPIGLLSGTETRSGIFETDSFMGGSVFRASAVAGEPKHLAYTAVTCLLVLATDLVFGGVLGLKRKTTFAALGVLFAGLLMTFSTQGFVILSLGAVVLLIGALLLRGVSPRAVAMLAAVLAVLLAVTRIPGLYEIVYERTVTRIGATGGLEDWNEAVWEWLKVNPVAWPFGVGLGNVHLHAAEYVPYDYLSYMRGSVFVAKAGILRIVSELGIVGMILFLATLVVPLRRLWARARRGSNVAAFMAVCGAAVTCQFLATADGPNYAFLLIGAVVGTERFLATSSETDIPRERVPRAVAST